MARNLHFLGNNAAKLFGFFLGIIECLLRRNHLTVKRIHPTLVNDAILKLLLYLFFGAFQTIQIVFGFAYRAGKQPLFLFQQLGVGGVKLQQLFNVFQLALGVLDLFVHAAERLAQAGCITTNLYGNAFDTVRHLHHLLTLQ